MHSPLQHWRLLALAIAALPLALGGCLEGDQGPAGPAGPPGQDGADSSSPYTYVGEQGEYCKHCHSGTVETVLETKHTHALEDLPADSQANPYCLQCHTTGWDATVAYGDPGTITEHGPDLNGYDDYFGVTGDEAAARREALAGVQCESCHGNMGPDVLFHRQNISFATAHVEDGEVVITASCYPCHSQQFDTEYLFSGHGTVAEGDLEIFNEEHYVGNASCEACHTSEGFIRSNDPAYATYDFGEERNFIGCVTCHDPHMGPEGGGNEAQLRNLNAFSVVYTEGYEEGEEPTMDGYGAGQLCAQCHHARRDNANVAGQISGSRALSGPHGSPQMDMFIGAGCYEIAGYDYERESTHNTSGLLEKACVSCHMERETLLHGEMQEHAFHTFAPENQVCQACHGDSDDPLFFDFEGGQTEVQNLLDELAVRFGFENVDAFFNDDTGWDSQAEGVETWQREVAYAMAFVVNDGSMGVHNPGYAKSLLENAAAYFDTND